MSNASSRQFFKMRDRRNTNLSVSSTESCSSPSNASTSCRTSLSGKRLRSPSPGLPLSATKEEKPIRPPTSKKTMAAKTVAVLCLVLLLWRYMLESLLSPSLLDSSNAQSLDDDETHLVAGMELPAEPTALMVHVNGLPKWTVSLPSSHAFPLRPNQYRDICSHADGLQATLSPKKRLHSHHWLQKGAPGYYIPDSTFLDVDEAEAIGVLPRSTVDNSSEVCPSSLTFVLESDQASFGKVLLNLWMSYGLAKHEGRAFFVDDSRWAWGNYTSYFPSPPQPSCSPPPAHRIVPCPHSAKHIVVSAATAPWTFGRAFHEEFDHVKHPRIFDLLRTGYEHLFSLTGEDSLYAASRIVQLKEEAGRIVGMQIRRGDLHPLEYQYSKDYLPLERYGQEAAKLLGNGGKGSLIFASDDPDILSSPELQPYEIQRAQTRIQLATKSTLDESSPVRDLREPGSAYVKHIDENSGWEGGFYSALFFSLGGAKAGQTDMPEQTLRLRELVGRAYLLDLAVMRSSDGIVCAVSSATCRVLGVMMSAKAIEEGDWVNVDDGRKWTWDGRK